MPFYQLPRAGQLLRWDFAAPRTVVRFGPDGTLVLLHATTDPALTTSQWHSQPVQLALHGTDLAEQKKEVPPVLCARLGEWPAFAAPVCLLELASEADEYTWLNARSLAPTLRLVLLRIDLAEPDRAQVETVRRVWCPEWRAADERLRLRLEQQCLRTSPDDAGTVQDAGRRLVGGTRVEELMHRAEMEFRVAAETPRHLFAKTVTA